MNGHATPQDNHFDVVIIGAGLSGVNAAYRVQTRLPHASYTILEGRSEIGGTWSLFKYPGIRSDSDLHTFGFSFNPWQKPNPIATGESICEYIKDTAAKFGIDQHIQFNHKIVTADWSSDAQHWRLDVDNNGERKTYYAGFIMMATGYYDYDKPLDATIPGLSNFKGQVIHPQFWPEDYDYTGKKMVIIGSGATAITMLPAVVDGGVGSVTMLQRSPSYILSLPQKKPGQKRWYDYLPRWLALRVVRLQFVIIPFLFYLFCRQWPTRAANLLRKEAKRQLPPDFPIDPHFKPAYNPWDQRLCLCPDGDFFKCFESGRANVVTDTIKSVVADGIELNSGEKLDADIIVTATGLRLQLCGAISLSVDKKPVDIPSSYLWRSCMITGVPNLGVIIGYVNMSWTLGSDAASRLLTRLMKLMKTNGYTSATPKITEEEARNPRKVLEIKSTYVMRGEKLLPHAGRTAPWLPRENWFRDRWDSERADLRKGLVFQSVSS
jgi:cation diffusion facilitator CzcD-associated flavoprotein CzcO